METKDKNDNDNEKVISEEEDLPSYNSNSIKEQIDDLNDEILYPPPENYHDYDNDEEEIKYSKKNDDGKNNENIDISKKDSKDNNLNIDSMINNNQSTTIKDKINDFSTCDKHIILWFNKFIYAVIIEIFVILKIEISFKLLFYFTKYYGKKCGYFRR